MKTESRHIFPHLLAQACVAVVLTAVCGCNRGPSLAEIEARERASRHYTTAMDDLQAGRVDAAIRGFESVLVSEPGNYSAHFQLATLLQDIKKDYIGAISHYRSYLLFRPSSDKATVASDRMRLCDTLLSAEYLRKAGGSATDKLSADNARIASERDSLALQVKRLEGQLADARKQIDKLTAESTMHKRLLAKVGAEAEAGEGGTAAKKDASMKEALAELRALEAEDKRKRLRPTDAELLDDDDSTPGDRIKNSEDMKNLRIVLDREEREDADKPQTKKPATAAASSAAGTKSPDKPNAFDTLLGKKKNAAAAGHPETYVVQEGDTLFKISTRFYGSSHKWRAIREANKAAVPPDGRLRVGQEIKLP